MLMRATVASELFVRWNIVLIHCASPMGHRSYFGKETETRAAWLVRMKDLSMCPNVTVKMGGILINLANFDSNLADAPPTSKHPTEARRPSIEQCMELFGAERCIVSSDFLADKVAFSYGTVGNISK